MIYMEKKWRRQADSILNRRDKVQNQMVQSHPDSVPGQSPQK